MIVRGDFQRSIRAFFAGASKEFPLSTPDGFHSLPNPIFMGSPRGADGTVILLTLALHRLQRIVFSCVKPTLPFFSQAFPGTQLSSAAVGRESIGRGLRSRRRPSSMRGDLHIFSVA